MKPFTRGKVQQDQRRTKRSSPLSLMRNRPKYTGRSANGYQHGRVGSFNSRGPRASWINLVEHFLADITEKQIRRALHHRPKKHRARVTIAAKLRKLGPALHSATTLVLKLRRSLCTTAQTDLCPQPAGFAERNL